MSFGSGWSASSARSAQGREVHLSVRHPRTRWGACAPCLPTSPSPQSLVLIHSQAPRAGSDAARRRISSRNETINWQLGHCVRDAGPHPCNVFLRQRPGQLDSSRRSALIYRRCQQCVMRARELKTTPFYFLGTCAAPPKHKTTAENALLGAQLRPQIDLKCCKWPSRHPLRIWRSHLGEQLGARRRCAPRRRLRGPAHLPLCTTAQHSPHRTLHARWIQRTP